MKHPTSLLVLACLGALSPTFAARAVRAADATVIVDFTKATGKVATGLHHGLNLYEGRTPPFTATPATTPTRTTSRSCAPRSSATTTGRC